MKQNTVSSNRKKERKQNLINRTKISHGENLCKIYYVGYEIANKLHGTVNEESGRKYEGESVSKGAWDKPKNRRVWTRIKSNWSGLKIKVYIHKQTTDEIALEKDSA